MPNYDSIDIFLEQFCEEFLRSLKQQIQNAKDTKRAWVAKNYYGNEDSYIDPINSKNLIKSTWKKLRPSFHKKLCITLDQYKITTLDIPGITIPFQIVFGMTLYNDSNRGFPLEALVRTINAKLEVRIKLQEQELLELDRKLHSYLTKEEFHDQVLFFHYEISSRIAK